MGQSLLNRYGLQLRVKTEVLVVAILLFSVAVVGYTFSIRNPVYIDEITYARLGFSLSEGHLASDSSFLSLYASHGLVTNGIPTPYGYVDSVEPWLDHPPLVGLLLIPFVTLGPNPRMLPLLFDIATVLLLYLLLRPKDKLAAFVAIAFFLLFLTLFPVLSMLFLDSSVSFFFLLTIFLLTRYSSEKSNKLLIGAGLSAGFAALSKVSGIIAIVILILFLGQLVAVRRIKMAKAVPPLIIASGIALIYPAYGFLLEPSLFWQLNMVNISRSVLSENSLQQVLVSLVSSATFTKPSYAQNISPFLQLSWVSVLLISSSRKFRFASLAALSYFLLVLALRYAPPQMTVPFFPYFAITMGSVVVRVGRLIFSLILRTYKLPQQAS